MPTYKNWSNNMTKKNRALGVLTLSIALGAVVVSVWGLIPYGSETPSEFLSVRGETVALDGHGLYRNESISFANQGRAQDWVTLLLGVPLLVGSWVARRSGNLRGQLLHAGTLGYFLYTYLTYAYLLNFNKAYLLYVAIFSLSLWAFVVSMLAIDPEEVEAAVKPRFPRRILGGYLIVLCSVIALMWLGRIVPALVSGDPPFGLEHYTSLGIQTTDLAIVVPAGLISGILLIRRSRWGLVLSAVLLMKLLTMGVVLVAMIVSAALSGIPASAAENAIFGTILLLGFAAAGTMVWWIRPRAAA